MSVPPRPAARRGTVGGGIVRHGTLGAAEVLATDGLDVGVVHVPVRVRELTATAVS